MKQYMLLPEDSIELLRAQDEAEAAVCVFCERTMILFPCSKIEAVSIQRSVTEDRLHPVNWSFLRGTRCLMRSRRF